MRGLWTAVLAAAAMTTVAGDAVSGAYHSRMGVVQLYSTSDSSSSSTAEPRNVALGQVVMITGECVDKDRKINVVLRLADDEPSDGWHSLLVTDMEMRDGNLHVRVPNMAQARNHTFRVKLYVGDSGCVCEAGSIRVG
jgi:hypothetical protein